MTKILLLWGAAAIILSVANYWYWKRFPETEENEGTK